MRHWADDKASSAILAVYIADADKQRLRAENAEAARDEARRQLIACEIDCGKRLAEASVESRQYAEAAQDLRQKLLLTEATLAKRTEEKLEQEMRADRLSSTIEILTDRINALTIAGGRRESDRTRHDDQATEQRTQADVERRTRSSGGESPHDR